MIYDRILLRYGDLSLKGRNKKFFIDTLYSQIQHKLHKTNVKIVKQHDRMYIVLENEDHNKIVDILKTVSGLYSYSLVVKTSTEDEDILKTALDVVNQFSDQEHTFKVEAKRSDKNYFRKSPEIQKFVASHVLRNTENLSVDVKNPSLTLNVEVRNDGCYIYTNSSKLMGGFPVGVAGKGMLTISGGIDSPVAGYLAMKQGVEVECLHFESTPLTSIESVQKVIDLTKKLAKYAPRNKIKLHLLPFKDIHTHLLEKCPEAYNITIMRRMFYRITEEMAKRNNCLIALNGESLGQVASQTLESMSVINEVTNMPIIRPLSTTDKLDIIKVSRDIDCYNISIKPFEDCCTIYVPKSPVTRPTLKKCLEIEEKLDFENLVLSAIENVKTLTVESDSDLDISMLGFEVKDVL